jgi:hypothetical protein
MASPRIVRSQINELIQTVLKSNVLPNTLKFAPAIPKTALLIDLPLSVSYEDTSISFRISYDSGDSTFGAHFFPNEKLEPEGGWHKTWSPVIDKFEIWLAVVAKETSQPDPWALLDQGSILKDQIPSARGAEEMFNGPELARLRGFLSEARNLLVAEVNPNPEQLSLIDERLSYLEESAKRQNKQDWAHTAVGVMFTIAIGLVMAPDQANRLFQLTANFIKLIFVPLLK